MGTNGILSSTNHDLEFIKSEIKTIRRGQNILFYLLVGLAILLVTT